MSELIVSRQQQVLLLTLNRPAARNALNNALLTQLVNELEAAATDSSISVCVITGNARFFAAGADLNEMAEKDLAATLNDTRPQLWARLQAFNKPLIAAVNGYALGAGCELALLCDVVVAGENARFGLPEITLGIMPGAGGTQRLIRSVGKSLASKMVLSGEGADEVFGGYLYFHKAPTPQAFHEETVCKLSKLHMSNTPYSWRRKWHVTRRWPYKRQSKRCASRRKWLCKPDLPRSDSYSPCWRQQKIVMKASLLSYKNARPTLKDANDGIHPQSCRKGRDDTNAQPPGTPEQF